MKTRLKTTGKGFERAGVRKTQPRPTHDERAAWNAGFRAFEAKHGRTPRRGWRFPENLS